MDFTNALETSEPVDTEPVDGDVIEVVVNADIAEAAASTAGPAADEPVAPPAAALAEFGARWLPVFERPLSQLTHMGESGPEYHEDVDAFVAATYEHDIVVVFDWVDWRDQGHVLLETSGAMQRTTALDLCKLITLIIRQERFAEGAIAHAIERGWLHSILARMVELHGEANAG
ncbi:MAG: hypothetical protein H7123_05180 [Thermoleophilia bacterium]|nr:hypothetical protein [Thermoleophilia bacterium]